MQFELLNEMRQYAKQEWIPIIMQETEDFLKVIVEIKKPKMILEIGTAIGYSALIFSKYAGSKCIIDTIEVDENMVNTARENIAKVGCKNINVIYGDAREKMELLNKKYDIIFIDAVKSKYPEFLEKSFPLINKGGLIIADNVSYKGMVEGVDNPKHKQRTAIRGLRKYLDMVNTDKRLNTAILNIGDGVAISVVN